MRSDVEERNEARADCHGGESWRPGGARLGRWRRCMQRMGGGKLSECKRRLLRCGRGARRGKSRSRSRAAHSGGADTLGRGDLSSHYLSTSYFVLRTVRSEFSDETNGMAAQGMLGRLDLAPIVGFETLLPS